jgi:hypothetical protein
MPRKRAAVTEGFLALVTGMWSLSRMDASMYCKGGSLNELFPTFIALVWPSRLDRIFREGVYLKPECILSEGKWLETMKRKRTMSNEI